MLDHHIVSYADTLCFTVDIQVSAYVFVFAGNAISSEILQQRSRVCRGRNSACYLDVFARLLITCEFGSTCAEVFSL